MKYQHAYLALGVILADQLSKLLIRLLLPYGSSVTVIPYVLRLTHTRNTGAGFSIFTNQNTVLIFLILMIIGALLYYFDRFKKVEQLFVALIIGGAFSNLIDRVSLGSVVDFLDVGFWPVFNVADSVITISVLGLLYLEIKN